jgi:hypothetical protein
LAPIPEPAPKPTWNVPPMTAPATLLAQPAPLAPVAAPNCLPEGATTVAALMPAPEPANLPKKEAGPPAGSAYVSSGVILRKSEPTPPAPTSTPAAGAPYVSKGTMVVSRQGSTPTGGEAVPVAVLQRRVEQVCGRAAKNIEVVALSDNKVEVRFIVVSARDGEQLSARIVAIPELAPYQVSFQVRLDH